MSTLGLPDPRLRPGVAALVVVFCLLAGCASVPKTDDPEIPSNVVSTAETYIAKHKKWPRKTYNLAIVEQKDDLIVLAVYRKEDGNFEDSEGVEVPIELTIRLESLSVIRELGHQ